MPMADFDGFKKRLKMAMVKLDSSASSGALTGLAVTAASLIAVAGLV